MPGEAAPASATLRARRVGGSAEAVAARTNGSSFRLQLPEPGEWEIHLEAEGFWSSIGRARVPSPLPQPEIVIHTALAARIAGTISTGRGEVVDEIRLRFWAADGRLASSARDSFEQSCVVKSRAFDCSVPSGVWDLRVAVRDSVPVYRWALRLESKSKLDLGLLPLVRGSSVSGFLEAGRRGVSLDEAEVTLRPSELSAAQEPLQRRPEYQGKSNPQGFFQVLNVAPGSYELVAQTTSGATAHFAPLQVFSGRESLLERPLTLEVPVRSVIWIDPPSDPVGHDWIVQVRKRNAIAGSFEVSVNSTPASKGRLDLPPLRPDEYLAVVSDSRGQLRTSLPFSVSADGSPISLKMEWTLVRGQVLLGDDPLRARLWFGGKSGASSVQFESDDQGAFAGELPRSGYWTVYVEADEPPIRRRISRVFVEEALDSREAEVEVHLEQNEIRGRVVDADGEPIASARVHAEFVEDPASSVDTQTDDDGNFSIAGVDKGLHRLSARTPTGRSRQVLITVRESVVAETTLRLEEDSTLRGRVLGAYGPVPGAMVIAFDKGGEQFQAATQADGSFSVAVRTSLGEASVVVLAPGHALSIFPIVKRGDEPVELQVSQAGGDLFLDLHHFAEDSAVSLWLKKEGLYLGLPLLDRWALANGERGFSQVTAASPVVRIPRVEAGDYELCWISASGLPRGCERGNLTAGAALTLVAPAP